eukprot:2576836-Rhodomonas_salina.1
MVHPPKQRGAPCISLQYRKPQFQSSVYQECGFVYLISGLSLQRECTAKPLPEFLARTVVACV